MVKKICWRNKRLLCAYPYRANLCKKEKNKCGSWAFYEGNRVLIYLKKV